MTETGDAMVLDFEAAKRVAHEKWLSGFEDTSYGPQAIHDADCVEFEWGWLIEHGPSRAGEVPPEETYWVLVDRVTGRVMPVSTAGPRPAIMKLLELRPPECRSPDVSVQGLGGLTRVSVSMRAFTPLNELQAAESKVWETMEVFRWTDRDN